MRNQICSLLAVAASAVNMRQANQTSAKQADNQVFSLADWFNDLDEQLTHVNLVTVAKEALMSAALDKNVAFFDALDLALPNFDLAAFDEEMKDVDLEELLNRKEEEFIVYCASFSKNYTNMDEFEERFGNWFAQDLKIKSFNKDGGSSFKMAQNEFSTWTNAEKAVMLMPARNLDAVNLSLLAQTKQGPVNDGTTIADDGTSTVDDGDVQCGEGSGFFRYGPKQLWECVPCEGNCKDCDFSLAVGNLADMEEMIWTESCTECAEGFEMMAAECQPIPEPVVDDGCKSDEYGWPNPNPTSCWSCAGDVTGCDTCTLKEGKSYVHNSCDTCIEGWQLNSTGNCDEAPATVVEPVVDNGGCKSDEYYSGGRCWPCSEISGCGACTLPAGKAWITDSCDACIEGWQLNANGKCDEAPEPVVPEVVPEPVVPDVINNNVCEEDEYVWVQSDGTESCWLCYEDIANCHTCTNQPQNDMYVQSCDTCNSGYMLSADKKSCIVDDTNSPAEPAASDECEHGFHKNEFGTCIVSGCPEGQWDNDGTCEHYSTVCDGQCSECFTMQGACAKCQAGYTLTSTGVCEEFDASCPFPYGPLANPAGCLQETSVNTLIPNYPSTSTEVDWRKWGVVNEVRNQGSCGSCWAFGAVAAVETNYAIRSGPLHELSEQHLVDCDTQMSGCNGGDERWAMNWFATQNGPFLREDYPYRENQGSCEADWHTPVMQLNPDAGNYQAGVEQTPGYEGFKASLRKGAVTIGFYVEGTFMAYGEGIFNLAGCPTGQMNHAMSAVGYGVENGQEFAIIRNSWGSSWGEGGYARVAMNSAEWNGVCDMMAIPAFPHFQE